MGGRKGSSGSPEGTKYKIKNPTEDKSPLQSTLDKKNIYKNTYSWPSWRQ